MCLYPTLRKNRKYVANKKNGGKVPEVKDKRALVVPVSCGRCMECKKKKARDWTVRLGMEVRNRKNGKMVTLSFSNEALEELGNLVNKRGYERDNAIATIGVRRYLERWRKKHKKSCKHWFVTELGGTRTQRIHIHGIMWTDEINDIKDIWKYGNVWVGDYVSERTVNYIVKYMHKVDKLHTEYNSKVLASAGIGKGYEKSMDGRNNKYKKGNTNETFRTRKGNKMALPVYYRNKIYNEEEREKLWLEKLDKQVRYVDGKKIDVSKGMEHYWKVLAVARAKSKKLGYGEGKINWKKKEYEEQLLKIARGKIWE